MRNIRIHVLLCLLIVSIGLAGCGGNKKALELRKKGIEQFQSGNYADAILSFEEAIQNSKGIVGDFELDVLKYRAEAEYQIEDYDAAVHTYEILLKVDEEKPEYYNMKCLAEAAGGRLKEALEDFEKACTEKTDMAELEKTIMVLGKALEEDGQTEQAMTFYRTILDKSGKIQAWVYNRMGLCELNAKNYDQALELFQKGSACQDSSMSAELAFNQAVCYEYKADFSKALELFESYVDSYGRDEAVLREIAFLKTRV